MLLHQLMRLAFEAEQTWLVEILETYREHEAAQQAFATADYEERVPRRKPSTGAVLMEGWGLIN